MSSGLRRRAAQLGKRKVRSAVVGGLLGLCLLGLLLKRVNLGDSWQTLRNVDPRFLLTPLLMFALDYLFRALRWQLLFPTAIRPDYWPTFRTYAIGTGINNLVPARAGDVARCVLISRSPSLAGSSVALGTLAVEKVLDGLTLLAIILVACLYLDPPRWLLILAVAAMALFGGGLVAIYIFRTRMEWFLARMHSVLRALRLGFVADQAARLLASFNEGLRGVNSIGQMTGLAALTLLVWITDAGCVWGMAKALGLSISLPYALLVTAVIGLGLAVPAAPASIGTYEFFAVAALGLAGITSAGALAFALLLHSWVFVTTSLLGLLCSAWAGLTFKQLARAEEAWDVQSAAGDHQPS